MKQNLISRIVSLAFLVSLMAGLLVSCRSEGREPISEGVTEGGALVEQSVTMPYEFDLALGVEDGGMRTLSADVEGVSSPTFRVDQSWEHTDWDIRKPLVLLAVSNIRSGGMDEQFFVVPESNIRVTKPRTSGGDLKIAVSGVLNLRTSASSYKVSGLVLDRKYATGAKDFASTGVFNLKQASESFVTQKTGPTIGALEGRFNNMIYGLEPTALTKYTDPAVAYTNKVDLRFNPLNTMLVVEFSHPTVSQVTYHTDGFTTEGTLSMRTQDVGTGIYKLTNANPLVSATPLTLRQVDGAMQARALVLALPSKGKGESYTFSATYNSQVRTERFTNSLSRAGKVTFVDQRFDAADYLKTEWNTGSDGVVRFWAAGRVENAVAMASPRKARILYREKGTAQWKVKEVSSALSEIRLDLPAGKTYEVWGRNLAAFRTSGYNSFSHNPADYGTDAKKLIAVTQFGKSNYWYHSSGNAIMSELSFAGTTNLKQITADDKPNLASHTGESRTSSISSMFAYSGIEYVNKIEEWDVSGVQYMLGTFLSAQKFNQNIRNWDVSRVTWMGSMFHGATSFNQPIGDWNVSNVTDMVYMFNGATSFNQPIGGWNVGNVTNMNGMFLGATSFNQPIGSWKVGNVTNMYAMFKDATSFNQPIGSWNVGNVTNMSFMFSRATSFNQPIGDWNVRNVTNMDNMFHGATSFNQPIGSWNVGNVTNMDGMFNGATSFNQPIGNWDVRKLKTMRYIFYQAASFDQNLGAWKLESMTTDGLLDPDPAPDPSSSERKLSTGPFSRSNLSVSNARAMLAGWRTHAEANPSILKNFHTRFLWSYSPGFPGHIKSESDLGPDLQWFKQNRGWFNDGTWDL